MAGGERAFLAGRHGLDHVERLTGATLAHHDAVGTHVQGVAQQVADGDLTGALEVGRAGFQRDHVLLAQLQLGGVLDGDDALLLGDERGEHVERGRLARTGAAAEEDVEARLHAGPEELEHVRRGRAEADQVLDGEARGELAHGDDRADERERLDDGVDAGTVGQASVDAGAGLVDVAAERSDDAVDDVEHVLVVAERDGDLLDAARALDVDLVWAVDHDLGDGRVGQQRLDGAEAGDLVDHALDQPLALIAGQADVMVRDVLADELVDVAGQLRAHALGVGEVDEM